MNASPLRKKYALTYLLVFLIPVLLLLTFIYGALFSFIENTVMENNREQTAKLLQTVDAKLQSIQKDFWQLSGLAEEYRLPSSRTGYGAVELSAEIKKYSIDEFLLDILLVYHNGDKVFSQKGTYTSKESLERIFQMYSEHSLLEYINQKQPIVVPDRSMRIAQVGLKDTVTFIYPVGSRASGTFASLVFFVDAAMLRNTEDSFIDKSGGLILLRDQAYNEISFENRMPDRFDPEEGFGNIGVFHSEINSSFYVTSKQERFYISTAFSEETGWSCMVAVSADEVMAPFYRVRNFTTLITLIVFLMGGLLTGLFSTYIYRPLKRLAGYARDSGEVREGKGNELDITYSVIQSLSAQKTALAEKVRGAREAQKSFLLMNLVKGKFLSIDSFNSMGNELGVAIGDGEIEFTIVYIHFYGWNDDVKLITIRSEIEELLAPELSAYGAEQFDRLGDNIFLCCARSAMRETLMDKLKAIQKHLHKTDGLRTCAGVGNACTALQDVGASYIQAVTAAEYAILKGSDRIVCYESIINYEAAGLEIPYDNIELLKTTLIEGDVEKTMSLIYSITDFIQSKDISLPLAKCICYSVVSTVLSTTMAFFGKTGDIKDTEISMGKLLEFVTVEEMSEALRAHCRTICERISSESEALKISVDGIHFLVNNYYKDSNFSVKSVAQHYKISQSNLSHFYKKNTNTNLSQTIDKLRMSYAKNLLEHTQLTIKEVTAQSGYHDVSNFIRNFKNNAGMSPGEYRRQIQSAGTITPDVSQ